ncbi:MAG TPA: FAD-binding oxidoreductase [Thermoleophilaceae bacterium]
MSRARDVAIIGGGIVGCVAAALLAEAGVSVEVFERGEVAGAASGRNSGSIQHPFDPVLAELHVETVLLYQALEGLDFPDEPAGVMMVGGERAALAEETSQIESLVPELRPELLEGEELRSAEPMLADGLTACRIETGYPIRPAAATRAYARAAHARGAVFHEDELAWPWVGSGRARGVIAGGVRRPAGAVLVTAGPWTPETVDTTGVWRPIAPVWGVVVELELEDAPRNVLEESDVSSVHSGEPGTLFSLVAADGLCSLGSTFLTSEPVPGDWVERLVERGREFVPAVAGARVTGTRACARPQSFDGRPLVGELPGVDGLWVAAGHGPWGMSTGPATARVAVDAMLGRGEAVPAELAAGRFGAG